MRLLVAEDERDLNRLISNTLKNNGYSVDSAYDGSEACGYVYAAEYDAIIMDIMMPYKSGLEVLGQMRRDGIKTPVLLLTALDSIDDRVRGLDNGADDYLVKPFSFDELLARIRVMTRRSAGLVSNEYKVADLIVNSDTHIVERAGKSIDLSAKEFALLEYMIINQGIVLSRDRLVEHVWNYDYEGGSNLVDVYIRYLRKKIDRDYDTKLIHTIRGTGYVLREERE